MPSFDEAPKKKIHAFSRKKRQARGTSSKVVCLQEVTAIFNEAVRARKSDLNRALKQYKRVASVSIDGGQNNHPLQRTHDNLRASASNGLVAIYKRAALLDSGDSEYVRAGDLISAARNAKLNGSFNVELTNRAEKTSMPWANHKVSNIYHNALIDALEAAADFSQAIENGKLVTINGAFEERDIKRSALAPQYKASF